MPDPQHLAIVLFTLNLVAFALFGLDKMLSRSNKRRISEKALLLASAAIASPGGLLGMVVFNHKTSKPRFRFGMPLLLVGHALLLYWISFA